MPGFSDRLSELEIKDLVALVRAFDPPRAKKGRSTQGSAAPTDFDKQFRRLQEELTELQRQFREARAKK